MEKLIHSSLLWILSLQKKTCVQRVLKSSLWDSQWQTYVFQSKIAWGIQKWVQNNLLASLPITIFFKKLFSAPKISSFGSFLRVSKKIVLGMDDNWFFWTQFMDSSFCFETCRPYICLPPGIPKGWFQYSWNAVKHSRIILVKYMTIDVFIAQKF